MSAEFSDLLALPELEIGHAKKVLFTRIIFTPGFMVIIREPRVPCTSTPPTSSFTALKENAHFIFPTARRAS